MKVRDYDGSNGTVVLSFEQIVLMSLILSNNIHSYQN